jgi:hypothetical protein
VASDAADTAYAIALSSRSAPPSTDACMWW